MKAASSRRSAARRPARTAARHRRPGTADPAGNQAPADPFSEAWWQNLCADAPPELQPILEQLNHHGRAFHALTRHYADALRAGPHASPAAPEAALQALEAALARSPAALLAPWGLHAHSPGSPWALTHSLGAGEAARAAGALESLARSARAVAEMLGAGTRWAGEPEETARRWSEYARAVDGYAALLQDMARDAVARVRQRIDAHARRGEMIDSPRALYEIWLECGEAAYVEMLRSERYARACGALINSGLALRRHMQELTGGIARLLGSADAQEQTALHRRVEALRRELRALRAGAPSRGRASPGRRSRTAGGAARTSDDKAKGR